jgi:cytochrome c oxidase subunit II
VGTAPYEDSMVGGPSAVSGSMFSPSSPFAGAIADAFVTTLVVCAVIGFGVAGAIAYSLVKFRRRPDGDEPPQGTGNRKLEILWTAVPLAIVAALFVLTIETMAKSDPPADRAPDLVVVGHQWWWEARYPSGVVTANEVHIPTDRPLLVRLESADVIHDFWVPQLARKMDAVPGHPNHFWMSADTAGSYGGACAEYCGAQHAWMRLLIIAHAPADFDAWQAGQLAAANAPAGASATNGERVFREQACGNCHAVKGRGFEGRVAPDLTHLASRITLGAGVIDYSPANLKAWLHDPQTIKPGSRMPDFKLGDAEVDSLVAYFEGLQ